MHARCPHCGAILDIDAQYAGHVVSCSACKQQFRAPAQGAAPQPAASSGPDLGAVLSGLSPAAATGASSTAADTPRINTRAGGQAPPRLGGAIESLFDFGMRTHGTPHLVKILYGLTFVTIVTWLVFDFFRSGYSFFELARIPGFPATQLMWAFGAFLLAEVFKLIFAAFTLLWTRVACEVAPALLRFADVAAEIERNTKK